MEKKPLLTLESEDSILKAADKLVAAAKDLLRTAKTEEDLRIGFEKVLEPLCIGLGIKSSPRYEKSIYSGGRSDALHGLVIIEYEPPKAFRSKKSIDHAFDQLFDYICGEAKATKETLFLFDPKFRGVGFDGEQIFFVQYGGDKNKPKIKLEKDEFIRMGPYPFDPQSARTLLTYLRSLSRELLTAENLAQVFGPGSEIAPTAVSAFVDALENWGTERVIVFLNEWKRLFGIVYGEQFGAHQEEEVRALADLYKVSRETDFQKLLFSVHTYFALLMKFIAAEIITLKESSLNSSFCLNLAHASKDDFKNQLANIEDGWIYTNRGITNFLEGDFFCWYLDALSLRLEAAIRDMTRSLSEFEPATTLINPESTRDLLKKLYQYLVPQEVRHKLGEYYTPDWLAELTLNEVGYDGNTLKRFLDPACGSGTFLVLAIQKAREYGRANREPPIETTERILANIWGFDMNPLAVIAARTNYLFALADIVHELPSVEIPVYLADSVLWPERRRGQLNLPPRGESIPTPTSLQTFFVPRIWIKDEGFLMRKAAPLVEKMAKEQYTVSEAMEQFKKEGLVFPPHEEVVETFYGGILKLEKQGKNRIWARFLKNVFAPMIADKFDFVVGNPPWIRWGYLSKEYREATLLLWQNYGLFSLKGHAARLGGGEKDFSMLFAYAAIDYYLKEGEKLGFLITQEVYKSKGAGEGFRRFRLGDKEYFKVLKAHDLVTVQPFEKAANKTAMIILKKGSATTYPVPYTLWKRKKGVGRIPTDSSLKDALTLLQKQKLLAQPIGSATGSWQTISEKQKGLKAIEGENAYKARRGASTEPYGVFWLEVKEVLSDGNIIVRNMAERGTSSIQQVEEAIEPNLVFPMVAGADIDRWGALTKNYVVISQDPKARKGFNEGTMKASHPRTYSYLLRFKKELCNRASFKKYHLEVGNPFYSQYNVAEYTFARYKVVWKRMANDVIASVISQHKTPFGYKTVIPSDTTAIFSLDDGNEAHYLCAIINSAPVREFVKTYSSAGRGFGAPSVMNHVGIAKFDPKNKLHQKLAHLSKALHDCKQKDNLDKMETLEKEVESLVCELFGIPV
ncbi:MAG: N-6 DNA methylase [Thermodesulfobacteriota bacterium]|jgi:methylase of polypeptide subunit release factors